MVKVNEDLNQRTFKDRIPADQESGIYNQNKNELKKTTSGVVTAFPATQIQRFPGQINCGKLSKFCLQRSR